MKNISIFFRDADDYVRFNNWLTDIVRMTCTDNVYFRAPIEIQVENGDDQDDRDSEIGYVVFTRSEREYRKANILIEFFTKKFSIIHHVSIPYSKEIVFKDSIMSNYIRDYILDTLRLIFAIYTYRKEDYVDVGESEVDIID